MILIENTEVTGFEHAIRGMRNPMNSWDKSDSEFEETATFDPDDYPCRFKMGSNDYELMMKLVKGGPVHAKFRRMINVYMDITAPLYWWKEFDTYKVGTVANSCSTMHKIHEKEFTLDDFSHEHLRNIHDAMWVSSNDERFRGTPIEFMEIFCGVLNHYRLLYLVTKNKDYWWQMIQLLPSSYNQKRTIMLNYEVLYSMFKDRRNHKLDEWKEFCDWVELLPWSDVITYNSKEEDYVD